MAAFAVLSLALGLGHINQSLFGDEIYAYQDVAGASLRGVLRHVNSNLEASPPLYFVMAWATAKLGDPTVWLRLPSILLGSATIPVVYVLGRDLISRRVGVIAAVLFALNPFTFFYAVQARPFAAEAFFVAFSTWTLVRAVRGDGWRWWCAYAVSCSASAYCHYTCIFALVVQGAWSLWICRKHPRAPLLSAGLAALLYVPWLPYVQARNVGAFAVLYPLTIAHVEQDLVRLVAGYPLAPIGSIPTGIGVAVISASLLLGLVTLTVSASRGNRHTLNPAVVLVVGLAFASPVGIVAYSLVAGDLWSTTAIYASAPAVTLLVAMVLVKVPRALGPIAVAATISVLVFGLVRATSSGWRRPPYRAVAAYLDRTVGPREPVLLELSIGNSAVSILLHRHIRLVESIRWSSIVEAGRAVVATIGARPQTPAGFYLLTRRLFPSHVVATTVWTFVRGKP